MTLPIYKRRSAPDWIVTIEDRQSTLLPTTIVVKNVVESISSASLSVPLNDGAEFSFELPADSPALAYLWSALIGTTSGTTSRGQMPLVRLRRAGDAYATGTLSTDPSYDPSTVFLGVVSDIDLSLGDAGNASVRCIDVVSTLDHVILTSKRYKNSTEASIRSNLIAAASGQTKITASQMEPDGWEVATTGVAGVTRVPNRSLTFKSVSILEALKSLSEMTKGFDFYGLNGKMIVSTYDAQYVGKNDLSASVYFGYGWSAARETIGNVVSGRATLLPPRNRIVTSNEAGKISVTSDSTSISNYGQYGESQSNLGRDATQAERDSARLRTKPRVGFSLTANPEVSPEPFHDYFPGDRIRIDARLGSDLYGGAYTVTQISIDFDEDLIDTSHSIEVEVL